MYSGRVDNFGCRDVAQALDCRGLIRSHLGLDGIWDGNGRDNQNHSDYEQKLDEGEAPAGVAGYPGIFGRL